MPPPEQRLVDRTLGDIAASLPGALPVLRHYQLDYCCEGDKPLGEAAIDSKISVESLCNALQQAANHSRPPQELTTDQLIKRILDEHHEAHREQLPTLIRLARKIEAIHRQHPAVPHGLTLLLKKLADELLDHMTREERLVFSRMQGDQPPHPDIPIANMEREHETHGRRLHELRKLTGNYQPPETACRSWRRLYHGLSILDQSITDHIHLESNLLYPRFQF